MWLVEDELILPAIDNSIERGNDYSILAHKIHIVYKQILIQIQNKIFQSNNRSYIVTATYDIILDGIK